MAEKNSIQLDFFLTVIAMVPSRHQLVRELSCSLGGCLQMTRSPIKNLNWQCDGSGLSFNTV